MFKSKDKLKDNSQAKPIDTSINDIASLPDESVSMKNESIPMDFILEQWWADDNKEKNILYPIDWNYSDNKSEKLSDPVLETIVY